MGIEPFTNENEDFGVRAVNVIHWWAWQPGMLALWLKNGLKQRANNVTINNIVCCNSMSFPSCDKSFIPDFTDPTTLDCLRGLVMKAYVDVLEVSVHTGPRKIVAPFVRIKTEDSLGYSILNIIQGNTEVEALIKALEAAPKKK